MIKTQSIYKIVQEEVTYIYEKIVFVVQTVLNFLIKWSKLIWEKTSTLAMVVYDWIVNLSVAKKVFTLMSLYLIFFLFWQFMAYNVSQPTFVIVNLVLVILSSLFTVGIIFRNKSVVNDLQAKINELESVKAKKDQEVIKLKSEIHEMNIATRKQQSFGKNSQVLIDAIKKYKKESRPDDPSGLFILKSLSHCYEICGGLVYMKQDDGKFLLSGMYAIPEHPIVDNPSLVEVSDDDALIGQVIESGNMLHLTDVPGDYLTIMSGLGETQSMNIYLLPIKKNGEVVAVVEVTSFGKLSVADIWKDIDGILLDD